MNPSAEQPRPRLPTSTVPPPAPRRYDPMAQFEPDRRPASDLREAGQTYVAFALVGAGAGVGFWLVYLVHAALFSPDKLGFLTRLTSVKSADLTATTPWGS